VVTGAQIMALCRTLPRSEQALVRDRVKFRVRGIVYVSISPDESSMGFGFPKLERNGLIAAEPEKFFLPRTSDLRFNWVCARLAALDVPEMRELIIDAWTMVVPKKVVREFSSRPDRSAGDGGADGSAPYDPKGDEPASHH